MRAESGQCGGGCAWRWVDGQDTAPLAALAAQVSSSISPPGIVSPPAHARSAAISMSCWISAARLALQIPRHLPLQESGGQVRKARPQRDQQHPGEDACACTVDSGARMAAAAEDGSRESRNETRRARRAALAPVTFTTAASPGPPSPTPSCRVQALHPFPRSRPPVLSPSLRTPPARTPLPS
jgi:hypothetical protein